jgi:hypothetical protein
MATCGQYMPYTTSKSIWFYSELMIEEILNVFKSFNPRQWAAMFAIVGLCITGYAWVESRYASRDSTDMILENLIAIDSKLSAIITTQFNKEQIKIIEENARVYQEQMQRYRDEKKSQ